MKSKRIVIATIGSLGDLHPAMGLALELRSRGHWVALATLAQYRERIEKIGLNFHCLRPDIPDCPEITAKIMHPTKGAEYLYRQIILPALSQTYADLIDIVTGCDLLIANGLILPASIVSEKIGIPWVLYQLQPASFFSAYEPPVLQTAPYLAKSRFLGVWVVKMFKQLTKLMTRS